MGTTWEEVKNQIKEEVSEKIFSLWINPINFLEQKKDKIILECPNKFALNWITENYLNIMQDKLSKTINCDARFALIVNPKERKKPVPDMFKVSKQLTLPNVPRGNGKRRFKREFTFDRFVVGKCNEFAYSASKALATRGGMSYNSLFLLSKTGLGKSHLSQSVGQAILEENSETRAFYITAEDFVNEIVFAIKNNRIEEFKNRYRRSCDVLLLEDVNFFSGKEKMQQELEHTLDALLNANKKIVFTSPLLPKEIPNISEGLSSRLTSGIIGTLGTPDLETRIKIIERKSIELGMVLSGEIVHFLAKHISRDVRQIESALRFLKARSELMKAKIDLDLAREAVISLVPDHGCLSIGDIEKIVCKYYKVDLSMLRSKSRKKIHTFPRNVYIYLCRQNTDSTLEEIGRSIDRNHSTVLYSAEMIAQKIRSDSRVKKEIDYLDLRLKDVMN